MNDVAEMLMLLSFAVRLILTKLLLSFAVRLIPNSLKV